MKNLHCDEMSILTYDLNERQQNQGERERLANAELRHDDGFVRRSMLMQITAVVSTLAQANTLSCFCVAGITAIENQ